MRRQRDEDIKNGIKGAKNRDIDEEYMKLQALDRIKQEKLRSIEDEKNRNPLMDEYLDEIYTKNGQGLINLMMNRKNRQSKNIDKNIFIEEYEKPE